MDSQDESVKANTKGVVPASNKRLNPEGDTPDGRRRSLLVGLAATPVILSLMSRSAFGNTECSLAASTYAGASPNAEGVVAQAGQEPNCEETTTLNKMPGG